MNDRPTPPQPEPDDSAAGDLPDVFDGLTAIDVIDGELVPRVGKPRPA